jgi:acyl-CoA synthetase (AMP-forming)/AMP-acid ligase II
MTPLQTSYWPASGVPERETTLGEELRARAEIAPGDCALIATSLARPGALSRWTYAELYAAAGQGARALLTRAGPGARVAVWAPNVAEWVILFHSSALAGMQLVPLNPALRKVEARLILEDAGCAALFAGPEHRGVPLASLAGELAAELACLDVAVNLAEWPAFAAGASGERAMPAVDPGQVALVQYTSGTTGRPKGALLSHRALVHASIRSGRALGLRADDVYVNPYPLFHVGGTVGAIGVCLTSGAALAPLPAYDAQELVELLFAARASIAAGVPAVLRPLLPRLAERPDLAGRLRAINSGAAPVPPALVEQYAELGVPISVSYGQSEAPTITRSRLSDDAITKATTVGQPVDGLEVKIVDPATARTMPLDAVGELWVRGTNVMSGYLNAAEQTRAVLSADGWLRTGDLATMSATGHCRIVGRLREVIIRGGENVYPREVEETLARHPDVSEVAVLGSADPQYGEQVLAVVVPTAGRQPAWSELAGFARDHLASFKVPRRWKFAAELPRNAAGKIQKHLIDASGYEVEERFRARR